MQCAHVFLFAARGVFKETEDKLHAGVDQQGTRDGMPFQSALPAHQEHRVTGGAL